MYRAANIAIGRVRADATANVKEAFDDTARTFATFDGHEPRHRDQRNRHHLSLRPSGLRMLARRSRHGHPHARSARGRRLGDDVRRTGQAVSKEAR